MTTVLHTADELRARPRSGPRTVVMTMGALHEGHATLIRTARDIADATPRHGGAQPQADSAPPVRSDSLAYGAPQPGGASPSGPAGATGGESRSGTGSASRPGYPRAAGGVAPGRGEVREGGETGEDGEVGEVVVTVFVNPLQFGPGEDLDRYPRTLEADLKVAEEAGADVVFAPSAAEVYPGGTPQVGIAAGPMGGRFEGASRPGHFDGVLTVVAKLLHLTDPDIALFGQKDAQQLALIRRMVRDLNFGVDIIAVPTVREDDGLALSSRNRYLSATERRTALALSQALFAGRDRHAAQEALRARAFLDPTPQARAEALTALGEARAAADAHALAGAGRAPGGPAAVLAAARQVLDEAAGRRPPLALDYVALVDPADFTEVRDDHIGPAVLAVAAKVGTTRLIDNLPLTFGSLGAAT
jgi:pantoate--beta-alanine ligase